MILKKQTKSLIIRVIILALALTFLYLPIMTLIVYSFNESKMVTVWTQFSLRWYKALFNNSAIITAVGISLTIAFMSAIASVIIGTLAAFVMVRVHKFHGESAFLLFMTAPMILPEVISGLALLLLFVTLGDIIPVFSDRGMITIWIAHVTFCSAYATVVIRSRFVELDVSIEEAAKDLGAGPLKVFYVIILPAIMPADSQCLPEEGYIRPGGGNCYWQYCFAAFGYGAIEDIQTARKVIMESEPVAVYEPKDSDEWNRMYRRWEEITSC